LEYGQQTGHKALVTWVHIQVDIQRTKITQEVKNSTFSSLHQDILRNKEYKNKKTNLKNDISSLGRNETKNQGLNTSKLLLTAGN
jgi:hypothetical protein